MCSGKPLARGTAVTLHAGTARLVLHRDLMLRLANLEVQGPDEVRKGFKDIRGMFKKANGA
jgi:hypothetical protein